MIPGTFFHTFIKTDNMLAKTSLTILGVNMFSYIIIFVMQEFKSIFAMLFVFECRARIYSKYVPTNLNVEHSSITNIL